MLRLRDADARIHTEGNVTNSNSSFDYFRVVSNCVKMKYILLCYFSLCKSLPTSVAVSNMIDCASHVIDTFLSPIQASVYFFFLCNVIRLGVMEVIKKSVDHWWENVDLNVRCWRKMCGRIINQGFVHLVRLETVLIMDT